jgi:hypothetical protein
MAVIVIEDETADTQGCRAIGDSHQCRNGSELRAKGVGDEVVAQ